MVRLLRLLLAGLISTPALSFSKVYACQTPMSRSLPFCNNTLSFKARVADLVGRLTQQEKISLLGAHGTDICAFEDGGVPRLGIPTYAWCTETNTGVSTKCMEPGKCATTFPSPASLAASFNKTLWQAKGEVQSTEQRALFNTDATRRRGSLIGLNGWGPNINVVRDPRYGRNSGESTL
jgi:beta-glucosidase-like glycosyl hydrolase